MRLLLRIIKVIFSSVYLAVVTFVGAPVAIGVTVLAGLILLPLPATLPIPATRPAAEPTIVYDRYGNVLATFQQFDQNLPVAQPDVPAVLKEAVISDEDRNFYHHGGVDLRGTVRALVADLKSNRTVQGGSTITQQYVKLAYVGASRTILRKVREAILASQLDRQASKDEILYRYLTLVYFGSGNYGVGAAAQDYFHVPVDQLNVSQSATLAGLIPAPSTRAPTVNIALAEQYRELVLSKMLQQGYLTEQSYQSALSQRLALAPTSGASPAPGTTVVYPPPTPPTRYPDFVDYVQRWLLAHGFTDSDLQSGGLRIQTTLDTRIQDDANAALLDTLKGPGTAPPLDMAIAAVQPQTGFVEAITGGRDFGIDNTPTKNDNFAISGCDLPADPAVQASADPPATCWDKNPIDLAGSSGRQPGSSWKPFVLAAAFEQGIQPTQVLPAPTVLQIPGCKLLAGQSANKCQVHNDEPWAGGAATLSEAMAASVNTVYAQLASQVGCPNVARVAQALGVESSYYSKIVFPYCETYALGELDVSPLDMASAYGVFDNHGLRAAPTPILEVVDAIHGKILIDNITHPPGTTNVMPANVADNVTNVLQGVLLPGGTAGNHAIGRPAAGKTGTTSDFSNAWFTGYTPTLSASVWMGRNTSTDSIGSVRGVGQVFGGTWPAAAWAEFMKMALIGVPVTPFGVPAPIVAPKAATALQAVTPTTVKVPLSPGRPSAPSETPLGGPYVVGPGAPPVAVPPSTTVPAGGAPPIDNLPGGQVVTLPTDTTTTSLPDSTPTG